jgi:hypothetical protein
MIPLQLKSMKFCKILRGQKKPFELEWTKKPYTYEEIKPYVNNGNYGVLCGTEYQEGVRFGALDDDSADKRLLKLYDEQFPETMQVRGHYYIGLKNWDGKKIIFYDRQGEHLGELQGLGQQVVGAGSLHPSGETYELKKDLPIVELDYADFVMIFAQYIVKTQVREPKPVDLDSEKLQDCISITQIFDSNLRQCPSCGCATGTNFKVFPETNSYFCFHSWTGGGVWEAIAISEGIKQCFQIGAGCLTTSEAQKIVEIAQDKYGLPKREEKDYGEVKGWANSVSIIKMAKKYNFEKCHICNTDLQFKDSHGLYYCPSCKCGGGLKQFASLIIKSKFTEKLQ